MADDIFVGAARAAIRPRTLITGSEWADKHAVLSAESSHVATRWRTFPYQREILDAMTDPAIERVSVMKSKRVGYTKMLNHATGYYMTEEPCPIMIVQPTIADAEGYSTEELAPMLRDTPILEGLVADPKKRDSGNTMLKKGFPGGFIRLVGANSATGFRRVSVRVVEFDEVDAYPASAGSEGDQILLGIGRTEFFHNRKIIMGSTPLHEATSRINRHYNLSDQRHRWLPCPFCDDFQVLKWGGQDSDFGIVWPDGRPEEAGYRCEHCHEIIPHRKLRWMDAHGEWRAEKEFEGARWVSYLGGVQLQPERDLGAPGY